MIVLIFAVYIVLVSLILFVNFHKSKNINTSSIEDETTDSEYFMYVLKQDKKKYDRLSLSDFIKINIKNMNDLSSDQTINIVDLSEEKLDLNDLYIFNKESILNFDSAYCYALCDMYKGDILYKDNAGLKEDVIKNKILDYSFLGYVCYEIPHRERIQDKLEIGIDSYSYSDYKNVQDKFVFGVDDEVMIFKQNKDDYKITTIVPQAKLISITDDKAIVCISGEEGNILKDVLDKDNVLISKDDISTKEEILE